ncbi:MAG: hypothetical protein UT14_C0046G0001 [Candidatus Shapirobacteria bacterium GW2011_GWE1_38_92]|uniref:Uncharacterized protein n=1 Tax=Candidatus Shapirobacteria bacterium GW2011_GWE1_38_92 TaxID=1618489 RepID=A0A0G0LPU8_9BACT|nr:MAG: hypothetical protein UT14_C0046G0001 [Candidatus Shapirobacteria bacterium GW2011_GWE1_38_92]
MRGNSMKILHNITVEEMISVFLIAELNSPRWGKKIENILLKNKIDKRIVTSPNISNSRENSLRALVLGEFRGYGKKDGLFDDIDEVISWKKVLLESEDFKKIKYIDYDYWNELSGKTGFVVDGAKNVKKGMEIFNVSNKQYWQILEHVKNGGKFPSLILLSDKTGGLKLLEGHVRLTGYLLDNKNIGPLEVIVGFKS